MYDQDDRRRRPQGDTRSWDDLAQGEGTYDPSFRPPVMQPDAYQEGAPVPPAPAGAREDFYYPPTPQQDPYGRAYGGQAYHFAPPPPQYVYPPPYAYPYPYPYPYQQPVSRPNPTLPVAGGVLVLVASILSLVWYLIEWSTWWWDFLFDTSTCFAIAITFAVIGIIGGVLAMMRRVLPMAIIGAVFSMISLAFFGVSFVLGLIGLILIAIGYNAFHPQYEDWEARYGSQYGLG